MGRELTAGQIEAEERIEKAEEALAKKMGKPPNWGKREAMRNAAAKEKGEKAKVPVLRENENE